MNIIAKRNWFFLLSTLVIVPGIISIALFGFKFSIDFTGGTLWELKLNGEIDRSKLKEVIESYQISVHSVQKTQTDSYLIRTQPISQDDNSKIIAQLSNNFGKVEEIRFETVGPTISKQLTQNAVKALALTLVGIIIYITWAFRKLPKDVSSFRFGATAVIALIHDVLVLIGSFSILGHFWSVEIDSLFITALLTVIGFSVHDTIVVYDRIRENLLKKTSSDFESIVNNAILQTLGRSIATSATVIFVLVALLLFGGVTIRWFVVALLIGIVSGTYSSIFNAAPLLVVWQNFAKRKRDNLS